jgi:peptide-methionine (S)-S-oxide reductase
MGLFRNKTSLPAPDDALPGRDEPLPVPERHYVLGTPLEPPFPDGYERAVFGMGCFWGGRADLLIRQSNCPVLGAWTPPLS